MIFSFYLTAEAQGIIGLHSKSFRKGLIPDCVNLYIMMFLSYLIGIWFNSFKLLYVQSSYLCLFTLVIA